MFDANKYLEKFLDNNYVQFSLWRIKPPSHNTYNMHETKE